MHNFANYDPPGLDYINETIHMEAAEVSNCVNAGCFGEADYHSIRLAAFEQMRDELWLDQSAHVMASYRPL